MKIDYNKKVMLKIVNEKSNLGKTSMMKIMFILQQVFSMKLGYNFNIYTYGPYASKVTDDLEMLIYNNFVDAETYEYKDSSMAYRLKITEQGKDSIDMLTLDDERKISKVLTVFGNKTAKELELDSTIIYTNNIYAKSNWDQTREEIVKDVYELKPRFTIETIQSAYDSLEEEGMLS
ncbi:MAG: hypothetical protein FWE20_11410 [Defluviitaleaceae bacterium]|nr:hypothetical protein [Defluviitaleaceae bacterium]